LNLMLTSRPETMAPRVEFFDGATTVIRSPIYVPEKELARYGQASGFTDHSSRPQGLTPKRAQARALLHLFGRD
jgi:hypothetical protein